MNDIDTLVEYLLSEGIQYTYFQFAIGAQVIGIVDKNMNFNFDVHGKILYLDRLES